MKRWMIRHANGGSATSVSGLTSFTGPFDRSIDASSWAVGKWGPATNGGTVTWQLCPLWEPEPGR